MEALRSVVMSNNADNIEDKPSLGGMYGSEGFFFQQRRGHLNLRSLASINLEKLVREVDVDILQIHIENITFCNLREEDLRYLTDPQIVKLFRISQLMLEYLLYSQDKLVENLNSLSQKYSDKKRGLSKKRRELAELEESTKLLRNQVKAKKQNISTLEDLLKEANRTREKELRKLKLQKGADIPDSSPPIVKFFIAGPEGLCVEFVEKSETSIVQLIREARKAFISKRDQDTSYDQGMVDLRLVFKGRLLLPEQTIEECEIRTGDTLMAMLVEKKKPETVAPAPAPATPTTPAVDHEAFTKQMFELITKQNQEQMRDIVQDINAGWKTALETISANSRPTIIEREPVQQSQQGLDPQVLLDLNSQWSRSQLDLQAKLDEMAQKQAQSDQELNSLAVMAARRRLRLGDMEDDSDDLDRRRSNNTNTGLDPGMFMGRIERVEHQSTYTSLDVERMKAELDALRRQLAERPIYVPTPVQVPVPVPVVEAPKPREMKVAAAVQREEVVTRSNKWDHLVDVKAAGTATEAPKVKGTAKAVVFEMATPAPVKQEPLPAKPVLVEKPKPAPKPPKPATPPPVEEPPMEREVDLLFPAQFNPQLAVLLFSKEDFKVTVPSDIPIDDLLFEVRKAASTKTRTKFAKVVMEYQEKRVLMGSDMGDEAANMTAATAKKLIASGDLRIGILPGNPLTNAQIDMLAPTWEKNKVFATAASREGALAMESGSDKASGAASKHKLRKRRNWDDEEPDASKSGARKSATFDDANDHDFSSEPGALPKGVYRQMRSSLDEALSEISEREGMTDEELQLQRAKLKDVTDSFPKHVNDHLKFHKGAVAGAVAAAAADSGSDSAAASVNGADDHLRTSGSFSNRNSLDRSVSRSMSLSRKDIAGQSGGMLRLSPGPQSPGDGDRSVSSHGSMMRRSLEQFHQEDELHSMSDDAPMLASITSSSDFRRRAGSPTRPVSVPTREVVRDTGVGIAHTASVVDHEEDRSVTSANAPLASASLNADSLMYSPSVSVSHTARSRYSTEEAENSDLDDSFSDRRPLPTSAVQAQRIPPQREAARGQGSKRELDISAEEPIVTRWSSAARNLDDTVESLDDDPELRADSKRGARADAGGKAADSVDSFKREYLAGHNLGHGAGFKGETSVTESGDRFRNTGDHTMMSSIPTLNDSVNSFSDQEPDYYKDRRNLGSTLGSTLGATSSTGNTDDMLSTTLDSDVEMLLTRNEREQDRRGGAYGAVRSSEVGRRADAYERDARGGHSKSNVEHFGHHHTGDDEGSINSLALSDSNNLDDL